MSANMANAIRSRTVQKGHDPRKFALVAFGGAGPMTAVEVARLVDSVNTKVAARAVVIFSPLRRLFLTIR
jgi:N-methylhydantoinase A